MTVEVYPKTTTVEVVKSEAERIEVVVPGPQGQRGATGLTGARGSNWYAGHGAPPFIAGQQPDDQYFDTDTGDTYGVQSDGVTWALEGTMPFNPGNYVDKTGDVMTGDLTIQSGHLHLGDGTISKSVGFNFDFNSGVSANELRVKNGNGVILQSPDNTAWVTIAWDSATNNALYVNYPLRLSGSIMAESASPSIFKQPGTSVGVQFEANGNDTTFVVRDTGDGAAVHSMATNSSIQANRTDSSGGARLGATGGISEVKLAGAGFHHWAIRNSAGNLQIGIADAQPEIGVGFSGTSLTFNANGDITIPQSLNAFSGVIRAYAGLALQDQPVLFRASTDGNHYIQYNAAQNGPDIAGYSGGRLGYMSTGTFVPVLSWSDASGIAVSGTLVSTTLNATSQVRSTYEVIVGDSAIGGSSTLGAALAVQTWAPSLIGAVVKGSVSQTADLQQWRTAYDVVDAKVNFRGEIQSLNALIGDVGYPNFAGFKHVSSTDYAVLADDQGFLYLNSSQSGVIWIRHNNTTIAKVLSDGTMAAYYFQGNNGGPYIAPSNTSLDFYSTAASDIPIIVRGQSAQWNDLQQWRRGDNTIGAAITWDGVFITLRNSSSGARINPGDGAHTGYMEFWDTTDRKGYIGYAANKVGHDTGDLTYVAASHGFTGQIRADDTAGGISIGRAYLRQGDLFLDMSGNNTDRIHIIASGGVDYIQTDGPLVVSSLFTSTSRLTVDTSGVVWPGSGIQMAPSTVTAAGTIVPTIAWAIPTDTFVLHGTAVSHYGLTGFTYNDGNGSAGVNLSLAGYFGLSLSAGGVERIRIQNSGQLIINGTNLTVDSNGQTRVYGTLAGLVLSGRDNQSQSWSTYMSSDTYRIFSATANADRLAIDPSGGMHLHGSANAMYLHGRTLDTNIWATYVDANVYNIWANGFGVLATMNTGGDFNVGGQLSGRKLSLSRTDTLDIIDIAYNAAVADNDTYGIVGITAPASVNQSYYSMTASGAVVYGIGIGADNKMKLGQVVGYKAMSANVVTIDNAGNVTAAGDLSVHVGGTPAKITLADGNVTKSAGVGFQFDSSVTATTVSDASGRVYSPGNPPPGGGSSINQTQRGTIAPGGTGSATATITSVNTAKTQLRYLGTAYTSASTSNTAMEARIALTNSTTITATWGAAAAGSQTVSYELTEWT